MLRKILTGLAASAVALSAVAPVVAEANPYYGGRYGGYEQVRRDRGYDRGGYDRRYYGGRGYDRGYYGRGYDDRRYYGGRGRCRDKGTGGTIIGAIAGGLLGNEVGNGRYDNRDGTTGAIVGAGLGALAGRSIDRDC